MRTIPVASLFAAVAAAKKKGNEALATEALANNALAAGIGEAFALRNEYNSKPKVALYKYERVTRVSSLSVAIRMMRVMPSWFSVLWA